MAILKILTKKCLKFKICINILRDTNLKEFQFFINSSKGVKIFRKLYYANLNIWRIFQKLLRLFIFLVTNKINFVFQIVVLSKNFHFFLILLIFFPIVFKSIKIFLLLRGVYIIAKY